MRRVILVIVIPLVALVGILVMGPSVQQRHTR